MKQDGRAFDRKTLETLRLTAVERVRKGERPSRVIASLGFCRTTIYKWLRASARPGAGLKALLATRGTGRPHILTRNQVRRVFQLINGKNPRQYGLDFGFWSRAAAVGLIDRQLGVRIGLTAAGAVLAKLDLTPPKPLRRASQRDPHAIEIWKQETFPGIMRQVKVDGADLVFWDDSGFRADAGQPRSLGSNGKAPEVERPARSRAIRVASAVNVRGAFWYRTYDGCLNAELFVRMLRQMMRGRAKPVHLVVEDLPAHQTKLVRTYMESTQGMLTVHVLPGSGPELSADRLVRSDG